eukprot:scaffold32638_cov112-Isochrysis_galbana.AAC.7
MKGWPASFHANLRWRSESTPVRECRRLSVRSLGRLRTSAWEIVPLYPKELTPTAAAASKLAWLQACVGSPHANDTFRKASSTRGLSTRSCAFPNDRACDSCHAALDNPTSPETGSVWPTLALTAAMRCVLVVGFNTLASAFASIGSPSAVPVPCASTLLIASVCIPERANASMSKDRCAEPFGAVRLALRPSCATALAATE